MGRDAAPRRLLRQLFEQAPDALMVVDDKEEVILLNARAEQLFGIETSRLVGQSPRALLPGWFEGLANATGKNSNGTGNVINMMATKYGGHEFCVEVSLSAIILSQHRFIVAGFRDRTPSSVARHTLETVNKQLEETNAKLVTLSRTDPLTDLFNRRGLEDILLREINYAKRNATGLLAVLVDLDDFKAVNDANGHAEGDRVLKQVAHILRDGLRAVDWIGRVGGDEFLLLLPCTSLPLGMQVAERVRLALNQNIVSTTNGQSRVTASLGLVSLPLGVSTIEEVLELTTATLKESKRKGKNRVSMGDSAGTLKSQADELKLLLNDSDQCRVVAQPIFRVANEAIVGYELFCRGPSGALESPEELFRISSDNDILTLVDIHLLKLSLKRASSLPNGLTKCINLFPSTLIDVPAKKLIDLVYSFASDSRICLEFSERRIKKDPTYLKEKVRELRLSGISIALDDIGYGFSSLESLLLLEPESVKIDGSCIKGVSTSSEQRESLSKLSMLARSIGIKTIAEGIETRDDFLVVKEIGIDFGQGWLWGKPS